MFNKIGVGSGGNEIILSGKRLFGIYHLIREVLVQINLMIAVALVKHTFRLYWFKHSLINI